MGCEFDTPNLDKGIVASRRKEFSTFRHLDAIDLRFVRLNRRYHSVAIPQVEEPTYGASEEESLAYQGAAMHRLDIFGRWESPSRLQ